MFFRGRSLRNPDPKGRIMLPPEFRELLLRTDAGSGLVLTTYDRCVVGFPLPQWDEFENKLVMMANPARKVRDFRRHVLGGAEKMSPDPQGRVRLSREHLLYAGIDKEALVVGVGSKFEIWAPERFASIIEQDFDDIAESIGETGINFGF